MAIDPQRSPRVLLAAQFAPPSPLSAARRVGGLTKHLERQGLEVTVLTSAALAQGPVPDASRTYRTRDLLNSRVNWRRGQLDALAGGGEASYQADHSRLAYAVVPDLALVSWVPFAIAKAVALHRARRFDCVITSSPPESAHLIGWALQRLGASWIADLRDGWSFESTHPEWPLPVQHRFDRLLEQTVARAADLVTTVTDPITDDLRARYGIDAVTIPNGFDPDDRVAGGPTTVELRPGVRTLLHTGRMAYAQRDPEPLLKALSLLAERRPDRARSIEALFAGPLSDRERKLIDESDGLARPVGTLPRDETLRLQNAADVLLLITGRDRRGEATAKLYEYLATGRQILVLGEQSAAAQIVRDAGCGEAVPADDPVAIAAAIERMSGNGGNARADNADGIARYSYESIGAQMASHVARLTPRA